MAGRAAGEGRERPGRPRETPATEDPADEAPPEADPGKAQEHSPAPESFREPGGTARQRQALDETAVRQVKEALLGAGLCLVGLGLAFLAFRMRRMY
ncbi:hypothetical protein [Streptomyces nitrosporeus]|uniref:hypothetical protein n=1 Tax=Streptomyces nitrosporeus TaxID=28894 RepID=UPI00332CEA96